MSTLLIQIALACIGAGLIAASGLTLCRLCGRDHVLKHRVLLLHLAAMVLLVVVQAVVPRLEWTPRIIWFDAPAPRAISMMYGAGTAQEPVPAANAPGLGGGAPVAPASPVIDPKILTRAIMGGVWGLLAALYGAIAGVLMIREVRSGAAAVGVLRRARPVTHGRALRVWNDVRSELGAAGRARLMECDGLSSPACWGLLRPMVLLPTGFADHHSDDTLACVLRHELVHLSRADHAVSVAAHGLAALLWPQPLVRMYARALEDEREASCDAIVVRMTGRAREYATALLECCSTAGSSAAVAMDGGPGVHRRILMLTEANTRAGRVRTGIVGAAAAGAILTVLGSQGILACAATPANASHIGTGDRTIIEMRAPGGRRSADNVLHLTRLLEGGVGGGGGDADPTRAYYGRSLRGLSTGAGGGGGGDGGSAGGGAGAGGGAPPTGGGGGGSIVEQETVASGVGHMRSDGILRAEEFSLSLPEDSELRAMLTGDQTMMQPSGGSTRLLLRNAEIRITDREGVSRVILTTEDSDATLILMAREENGEYNIYTCAKRAGETVRLLLRVDTQTGKPEGEKDQPVGSVRWELIGPGEEADNPWRLKMRWSHDKSGGGAGGRGGGGGAPPADAWQTHTVVPQENLQTIAEQYLGRASLWPEIVEANGLTSTDIRPGQTLKIRRNQPTYGGGGR